MAIDLKEILKRNAVPFVTSGAEVTKGWINMRCPFCSDTKTHLGYSSDLDLFTCWKCGVKGRDWALSRLLGISVAEAGKIADRHFIAGTRRSEERERPKELALPENFGRLMREHRNYLRGREYDPAALARTWGLVGSDDPRYRDRILIPIHYKGQLVSYTSRSIDEDAEVKAKACRDEDEVVHHKDILYGFDQVPGNTAVVVEGPPDVWRLGPGAVGAFGIKFTENQIKLLALFKNIFVLFDSEHDEDGQELEKAAQAQAQRLSDKLSIFNNVWTIGGLGSDPGDLSDRKAARLMKVTKQIAEEAV